MTPDQDDAPIYEIKFDGEFDVWMVYTFALDEHDNEHHNLVAIRDTEDEAREVLAHFKTLVDFDDLHDARKLEEAEGGELQRHLHHILWRYGVESQGAFVGYCADPGEYDGDHTSALASVYGDDY